MLTLVAQVDELLLRGHGVSILDCDGFGPQVLEYAFQIVDLRRRSLTTVLLAVDLCVCVCVCVSEYVCVYVLQPAVCQ